MIVNEEEGTWKALAFIGFHATLWAVLLILAIGCVSVQTHHRKVKNLEDQIDTASYRFIPEPMKIPEAKP